MAEKPKRRVRITLVLDEDTDIPWTEEKVRMWFDQSLSEHLSMDPTEWLESVEFPDGVYGEITDDDLFS